MSTPEIDPVLFTKEGELDYAFAVTNAAEQYSSSLAIIERYQQEHSTETQKGRIQEVQETEDYQKLAGVLGDTFKNFVVSEVVAINEDDITDEAYEEAIFTHANSEDELTSFVFGYQTHMADNLRMVYSDDEQEVAEAAWTSTWQKLRGILHPVGRTYLAEVADYFDSLIKLKYGQTYDPTDRLRGTVVSEDISAQTFYEVMEEHLSRAIMRSGEDGWTGL